MSLPRTVICGLALTLSIVFFHGPPARTEAASAELTFAFWNLENLFDVENDPNNTGDDEFLPINHWTAARYGLKLDRLAEVLAAIDADLIGVCEVENERVLEDLLKREPLSKAGYSIAHRDSPDKRGIDLALLYRTPFELSGPNPIRLHDIHMDDPSGGPTLLASRGILEVRLEATGQPLTVLVNHWPSRWGGTEQSAPRRKAAAELCRRIVLERQDPKKEGSSAADILIVGDLNDDPFDASVRTILKAVPNRNAVLNNRKYGYLYNPSWKFLADGEVGTYYYNSEWVWNVFDQCVLSKGLLDDDGFRFVEGSLEIYSTEAMRDHYQRPKRFKKSGKKNEDGTSIWTEGYSDHFPIHGKLRCSAPTGG